MLHTTFLGPRLGLLKNAYMAIFFLEDLTLKKWELKPTLDLAKMETQFGLQVPYVDSNIIREEEYQASF